MSNEQTWTGRPVDETKIRYQDIDSSVLPTFSREDFTSPAGFPPHIANPYLDTIVNEINGIPVATVSKSYSLVQHQTAIDVTLEALASMGYSHQDAECELTQTKLGERMWLRIRFPEFTFDPGDGHIMHLELSLFNSVDRSMTFGFEVGWYRLICANGMTQLERGKRMNRRHTASLSPSFLSEQLQAHIQETLSEREIYKEWREKKVAVGRPISYTDEITLEDWVDQTVTETWGKRTAARAYSIIKSGWDGDAKIREANEADRKASRVGVIPKIDVPGSDPAETALDVAHSLSWIASHQETVQTRMTMMRDVPKLMDTLTKNL